MKTIFNIILLTLICCVVKSQSTLPATNPTKKSNAYEEIGWSRADSGFIVGSSRDTSFHPISGTFPIIYWLHAGVDSSFWTYNGIKWVKIGSGGGASVYLTNGIGIVNNPNPITSTGTISLDTSYTNATYVRIQTQSPYGFLVDSSSNNSTVNIELHSAGTFNRSLYWEAGRYAATQTQGATAPLSSIVVNGISQSFSQPSAGNYVTGRVSNVSITYNSNTTFSNVITTTDSKSVTYYTSYNFYSTYYLGYVSSSSPTDANLYSAGYNFLNTANSRVTSGTLPNPSSSSYIVFAYPSRFGTASITVNGLGITYNLTTRTVVNQSGYSETYYVYVSPFPTASGITYSIN
jgi:hypothetical protein